MSHPTIELCVLHTAEAEVTHGLDQFSEYDLVSASLVLGYLQKAPSFGLKLMPQCFSPVVENGWRHCRNP